MGETDSSPIALAGIPGTDVPDARREVVSLFSAFQASAPPALWSRSQWFQSEVTEGLGLKRWDVSET